MNVIDLIENASIDDCEELVTNALAYLPSDHIFLIIKRWAQENKMIDELKLQLEDISDEESE